MAGAPGDGAHERPEPFYQGLSEALAEHAQAQFKLRQKQPDGNTLRTHLEAAAAASGKRPPELEVPPLPREVRGLWADFCRLDATRTGSGFGVNPIDEARLLAWQQLHRVRLSPWEIEQIQMLDVLSMNALAEEQKTKQPSK